LIFPKLKDIATKNPLIITSDKTVWEAIDLMVENNIQDVIIKDEFSNFFGIITLQCIIKLQAEGVDLDSPVCTVRHDSLPTFDAEMNVLEVIGLMDMNHRYVCVLDKDGQLYGIISYHDIITHIDPKILVEKQTIGTLVKCSSIFSQDIASTMGDIVAYMREINRDTILIEQNGAKVGIVTATDIALALAKRNSLDTPISDVMTSPVVSLDEHATLKEALDFIQTKHFRRIVVAARNGTFIGIITKQDLVYATYNRWVDIVMKHSEEIVELNDILKQKNNQLEKIAFIDTLTGIYNRGLVSEWVEGEKKRIARYKLKPFSIFMADIDHFKNVNDTYGHLVGDRVLKELAEIIKKNLRTTDFVARWGGEEFLALMPMTTMSEAIVVCEKINLIVAKHSFDEVGQVTISIGVSQYGDDELFDTTLCRADEALYEAKHNGRNCVMFK